MYIIFTVPTFTLKIHRSPRKNIPVSCILMGMMEIPHGFTRKKPRCCCCRWSGLDTYVRVDFRGIFGTTVSLPRWGVYSILLIPMYTYRWLYAIYIYIHNGIWIYIVSTSLFHSCLTPSIYMLEIDVYAKQKQQQRLMSNVTLPSRCTSADGSGIASGVVLMPKDSKKLSGDPTAISLGKAHLKITPPFFQRKIIFHAPPWLRLPSMLVFQGLVSSKSLRIWLFQEFHPPSYTIIVFRRMGAAKGEATVAAAGVSLTSLVFGASGLGGRRNPVTNGWFLLIK